MFMARRIYIYSLLSIVRISENETDIVNGQLLNIDPNGFSVFVGDIFDISGDSMNSLLGRPVDALIQKR